MGSGGLLGASGEQEDLMGRQSSSSGSAGKGLEGRQVLATASWLLESWSLGAKCFMPAISVS
jgi:hypothetical protein